jgi:GGDEF domain-containing protein
VVTVSGSLASTVSASYADNEKNLNTADAAQYVAKRSGRNCICWPGDELATRKCCR